ncbi:MAG: hypothetical protein WCO25_05065 [Candidatus Uhrbacteria bacterium]
MTLFHDILANPLAFQFFFAQLALNLVGFPMQIWQLWKAKNSSGLSLAKFGFLLYTLAAGFCYVTFAKPDPVIAANIVIQFVCAAVITAQIVHYRRVPGGRRPTITLPRLA